MGNLISPRIGVTNQQFKTSSQSQVTVVPEIQISEGGEAELGQYKENCKKNPGHPKFIPIKVFRLEHLPEKYRNQIVYNLIQSIAGVTVSVQVRMTSLDRPDFWPRTTEPYQRPDNRGSSCLRTGTATIYRVRKKVNKGLCPCSTCKLSDRPSQVWWKVRLCTATHVVFDNNEASQTTFKLFYDGDGSQPMYLFGAEVPRANIDSDVCFLISWTCNPELGTKLEELRNRHAEKWEKFKQYYNSSKYVDKFVFIVSHPHGCSKQVSFGERDVDIPVEFEKFKKFTYSTCTCPGSSGASVWSVGYMWTWNYVVHSGTPENSGRYNISGGVVVNRLLTFASQ